MRAGTQNSAGKRSAIGGGRRNGAPPRDASTRGAPDQQQQQNGIGRSPTTRCRKYLADGQRNNSDRATSSQPDALHSTKLIARRMRYAPSMALWNRCRAAGRARRRSADPRHIGQDYIHRQKAPRKTGSQPPVAAIASRSEESRPAQLSRMQVIDWHELRQHPAHDKCQWRGPGLA